MVLERQTKAPLRRIVQAFVDRGDAPFDGRLFGIALGNFPGEDADHRRPEHRRVVDPLAATLKLLLSLGEFNVPGTDERHFGLPADIAFLPDGTMFVADGYYNSRIVKFTREGKFITAWGKKGAGEGDFNLPHSVAVDKEGRVYVGDRENYRMQVFDANGKFIAQWKHIGSPWGVVIADDGSIFMCDGHNNRILKLDRDGKILGVLSGPGKLPGELDYSHHLAIGPSRSLYVAEIKNWRVQKFAAQ